TVSLFFFFSSRRRHTIFKCDWSSDVCSSDLGGAAEDRHPRRLAEGAREARSRAALPDRRLRRSHRFQRHAHQAACRGCTERLPRSEERRVGKECTYWDYRDPENKTKR